jgi:aminoglycoside phosphotransferase (APT) family kinase protein
MDADARLSAWLAAHLGIEDAQPGRRLGGGNSNVTQLITHRAGQVVLRRPPDNAISASAANGVRREHRMLQALEGRARVPRPLGFCDDVSVIGQPFAIVEFVDGVAITGELPPAYAQYAATLNRMGEELVDGIAAVHALDWTTLGLEGPSSPETYVRKQVERWLKVRAEDAVRDLPLVEEIGRWLLARLPAAPRAAVMHGDFHLDNTLFRRDAPALAAIIDWELATIGDPLTDLALMLAFWGPRAVDPPGFAFVQRVTRGVPGLVSREALAERWSRATGIDAGELDYYLVFAFWRLASIVEGAYALYRRGRVADDYSRNLERDVPALLQEAAIRAGLRDGDR